MAVAPHGFSINQSILEGREMKKMTVLFCILLLCMSLFSCSDNSENNNVTDGQFTSLYADFGDYRSFSTGDTLDVSFITMPKDYDLSNIDTISDIDGFVAYEYHDGIVTITFIRSGVSKIGFSCDGETSNFSQFSVTGNDVVPDSAVKVSHSLSGVSSDSSSETDLPDDSDSSSGSESSSNSNISGGSSSNSGSSPVGGSVSQRNALDRAKSYLSSSSFSRQGLIEQLEFEGFSTSDATYAVDHVGVDWNEQAVSKAKSYLRSSHFSYSGLVDQLEFEGFTFSQATYGVDRCGADWNEQAALKAADYLKFSSFSRQGLIDQLVFEGFTAAQAEYGVNAVGL